MGVWIWGAALGAYALFRLWYDNWAGPLKPAEIDAFLEALKDSPGSEVNDTGVLRRFLETDDGKEFFMLNLVKVHAQAPHPETGEPTRGRILLDRYIQTFMPALFARGGHPALAARPLGGYVDAWNTEPDPGWSTVGYMRYRSRRDLARLAADPRFKAAHGFKIAGLAKTYSFPTRPVMSFYAGPRVWVALVLALIAALAQLALV